MAVANPRPVTALFDVPANQEAGPSLLEIVTNGVASEPTEVLVK
jgi:mRNA-degrading endonuclease toxin of MazEF toxin-antitoxin module